MTQMCNNCIAGMEEDVKPHKLFKCPDGVCPVCWSRYGTFIPVCVTASNLPQKKDKTNEKESAKN